MDTTGQKKETIAVIGAGIMGQGIIKNLQASGYPLRVYNRSREKVQHLTDAQVVICDSPADAARGAAVIFSAVTDDQASESIWFGPQGVLQSASEGAVGIELSTLSVAFIDRWSQTLRTGGLQPLDCPVTGSKPGAMSGTLSLFVGGEEETIRQVRAILDCISSELFHLGASGSGSRFKLIYNTLSGTILVALAESLGMAQQLGLDVEQVAHIFSVNGWSSKVGSSKAANMLQHAHDDVNFTLRNMNKDLIYTFDALDEQQFPVGSMAQKQLQNAVQEALGDLDMSAISEIYLRTDKSC